MKKKEKKKRRKKKEEKRKKEKKNNVFAFMLYHADCYRIIIKYFGQ